MYCTQCGMFNSDERTNCNNCGESMSNSRVVRVGAIEVKGDQGVGEPGTPADPVPPKGGEPKADMWPRHISATAPSGSTLPPVSGRSTGASGRSILAMVLSIVGIAGCGPLTSIAGMIIGKRELTAIREGRAPTEGTIFAKIGFYLGAITTVLYCGLALIWLGLAVLAVLAAW